MVELRCGDKVFSGIQAIIFDKDGTLEDSADRLRRLAIARSRLIDARIPGVGEPLLMAFGVAQDSLDPAGLMATGSHEENEIAAAAYIAETGRSWYQARLIAREAFAEASGGISAGVSPIFPGCLEVIDRLHSAGLAIGILSAAGEASVGAFMERHQLEKWVRVAMGVSPGRNKPDPALFIEVCQALGVASEATLMIGDGAGDIAMAQNAGAAGAIGICWGKEDAPHLQAADVRISRLDAIEILSD